MLYLKHSAFQCRGRLERQSVEFNVELRHMFVYRYILVLFLPLVLHDLYFLHHFGHLAVLLNINRDAAAEAPQLF